MPGVPGAYNVPMNTTTQQRYAYLLTLCREGVATAEETQEFFDLCQQQLYAKLTDSMDVLKRLADR